MPPKAEPIDLPNDPRVQHRYALLDGIKYHYLYAEPKNREATHTVFLVGIAPSILLFLETTRLFNNVPVVVNGFLN
jgi:hypothetical protein